MKQVLAFLFGCVFFGFLTTASFAEEVSGTVESVDGAKNKIVLRQANGTLRTVAVHAKVAKTLKKGSVVKAALKQGTATADTVEVEL